METILFIFFTLLTLSCAAFVITAKNPIHSVLFLVLVFFNVASLLIFLGVEFLALLFLIVYVGAVAVLFLFIIMMLSVKIPEFKTVMYQYLPIGLFLGACLLCEALIIFEYELVQLVFVPYTFIHFNIFGFNPIINWSFAVNATQNIKVLASVLYTEFSLVFILAGVILLTAMLGAILLTLHRRSDTKRQDIFKQVQQGFNVAISWKK